MNMSSKAIGCKISFRIKGWPYKIDFNPCITDVTGSISFWMNSLIFVMYMNSRYIAAEITADA